MNRSVLFLDLFNYFSPFKFQGKVRNSSYPERLQSYAPTLPVKGSNGVATSSYDQRNGLTPISLIELTLISLTSKSSVPKIATGRTPLLFILCGLGHDHGFMATITCNPGRGPSILVLRRKIYLKAKSDSTEPGGVGSR